MQPEVAAGLALDEQAALAQPLQFLNGIRPGTPGTRQGGRDASRGRQRGEGVEGLWRNPAQHAALHQACKGAFQATPGDLHVYALPQLQGDHQAGRPPAGRGVHGLGEFRSGTDALRKFERFVLVERKLLVADHDESGRRNVRFEAEWQILTREQQAEVAAAGFDQCAEQGGERRQAVRVVDHDERSWKPLGDTRDTQPDELRGRLAVLSGEMRKVGNTGAFRRTHQRSEEPIGAAGRRIDRDPERGSPAAP